MRIRCCQNERYDRVMAEWNCERRSGDQETEMTGKPRKGDEYRDVTAGERGDLGHFGGL